MPTYEYRCPNGHDFEHFFRKISDARSEMQCPACGVVAERRLSGGAGLLFKGSGFYLTDYGKNAHRKPAASGADGAKPEGGKSEGGTGEGATKPDAKPEAKPESKPETKAESKPAESKAESKPAKKGTGPAE